MTRLDEIVRRVDWTCSPLKRCVIITNRKIYDRAHELANSKGVKLATVGVALVAEWLRQGADESIIRNDLPINRDERWGFALVMPTAIKQALDEVRAKKTNFTTQPLMNTLLMAWCDANGAPEISLETVEAKQADQQSEPKPSKLSVRIGSTVQARAQTLADEQGIPLDQVCSELLTKWVENGEDENCVTEHPVADRVKSQPKSLYMELSIKQRLRASARGKGFTLGDLMTSLLERWCEDNEQ